MARIRLRKLILLLAAMPFICPAQQVTVAQFEASLPAFAELHDNQVADKLAAFELTERLSSDRLAQLKIQLPGEKSRQALMMLADASEFLAPPPAEIPATAAPDDSTQRAIMARVVDYVTRTNHKLPNFYATRTTTRYEDWPKGLAIHSMVPARTIPLRQVDVEKAVVTYRNGAEVVTPAKKPVRAFTGLSTRGLFGPVLRTVLVDAARGASAWSRWEQYKGKTAAVFRYSVPVEKSGYDVHFCCYPLGKMLLPIDGRSAYHGEITADPDNGTILRLTLIADLHDGDLGSLLTEAVAGDPLEASNMMVEYAPVEIGGKMYFCPRRSVAISRARALERAKSAPAQMHVSNELLSSYNLGPLKTYINDATFTGYHVFRSESRMIY